MQTVELAEQALQAWKIVGNCRESVQTVELAEQALQAWKVAEQVSKQPNKHTRNKQKRL